MARASSYISGWAASAAYLRRVFISKFQERARLVATVTYIMKSDYAVVGKGYY